MPEKNQDRTVFSLLEVTQSIQKTLAQRYTSAFWVKAEMGKLNYYPQTGHCYPDLVEKQEGKVMAQIRANLWKTDFDRINTVFLKLIKEPLRDGINIMFSARVAYDPQYGLSLRILDIDPSFSLGEIEREKLETIERLKKDGLFGLNKMKPMPVLPKRIAIISVQTSKGYADFTKVTDNNPWGYKFFYMLFPALLQGEKAVQTIIYQLNQIRKVLSHFDVVTIIRGGGGDVGLSSYNHYDLVRTVATFPIPVLTGIGHSTNETVTEMVAFKNAITPTELADFLIQKFHNFSVPVKDAENILKTAVPAFINDFRLAFQNQTKLFNTVTQSRLKNYQTEIINTSVFLSQSTRHKLETENNRLQTFPLEIKSRTKAVLNSHFLAIPLQLGRLSLSIRNFHHHQSKHLELSEKSILLLDPINVLKRGYSITYKDGKLVKNVNDVNNGDLLETKLADGSIISKVEK